MDHKDFINQLDEALIVNAIADAEKHTSGEIRLYVSHKERHDALEYARRRFRELGMARTQHRNAVLIYIVPRTRQFALYGDSGIHQKCGDGFWTAIAQQMSQQMKEGLFSDAVVNAVHAIGKALSSHFPPDGNNPNELSNEIARD